MSPRFLLKLSGEFFSEEALFQRMAAEILEVRSKGIEVAMVVGGGNLWRYRDRKSLGLSRLGSDTLGMIATLFNARFIAELLKSKGIPAVAMAPHVDGYLAEEYIPEKAVVHLEQGQVVVCGGGTGNPFFTTDTTAALRALELSCSALLKGTKVDGVYDSDPVENPSAQFFPKLSYQEMMDRDLKILDLTAVQMCREHQLPIRVFNAWKEGSIVSACQGDTLGSLVS